MNAAEHITAQVRWLAESDQITRTQLVEIITELLTPFIERDEPPHFLTVNAHIHRILDAVDPSRNDPIDD